VHKTQIIYYCYVTCKQFPSKHFQTNTAVESNLEEFVTGEDVQDKYTTELIRESYDRMSTGHTNTLAQLQKEEVESSRLQVIFSLSSYTFVLLSLLFAN
jgi:hypothetical protein